MKHPIFIVGPHRGGSTLWHNLIAMCPGIMRLADPRFLGYRGQRDFRFFLKTQARTLSTPEDVNTLVELLFSRKNMPGLEGAFWRFEGISAVDNSELRREVARRIMESNRSIGAIARILIEEITRFSGCERACMKFPVDVGHIPELMEWFPDCKIVHITRDPRALAMSKSNDPSGTAIKVVEHPSFAWLIRKVAVWSTIIQYRLGAKLHLQFKELPNYRLFRYEDLLADPERVLRELCEFIETDFREEMLEPQKGRHEHQPSSLTGKRQKAFDPAAATRWRTVISRSDYWLISLLTRRSMKKLGYNPKTHPIFRRSQQGGQRIEQQAAV
jgi:Sulfotransferase family